jgi:hypothetical protein
MRAKLLLADGQDDALTIQWASLYQKRLQDLCGYIYPRIKMIEFAEEPTEVRRAPDELQIEMVQRIAWQLGYRFEPKLEDDRGTSERGRPKVEASSKRERAPVANTPPATAIPGLTSPQRAPAQAKIER